MLIIQNHYIVFQNFVHKDLYNFAYVCTNCSRTFATLVEISPKTCILNEGNCFFKCRKTLTSQFVFLGTGIKKSFGAKWEPVFPDTGGHLLVSASCAYYFSCIWLILKWPYSRLLLMRLNPLFISCFDVIDVIQSTAIEFLEHFLRPIGMSRFWQSNWIYGGPTNALGDPISR